MQVQVVANIAHRIVLLVSLSRRVRSRVHCNDAILSAPLPVSVIGINNEAMRPVLVHIEIETCHCSAREGCRLILLF